MYTGEIIITPKLSARPTPIGRRASRVVAKIIFSQRLALRQFFYHSSGGNQRVRYVEFPGE